MTVRVPLICVNTEVASPAREGSVSSLQFDRNDDPNRRTLSINNTDIKLNVKPTLPPPLKNAH